MKIRTTKTDVELVPEDDLDCFTLGGLSIKIPAVINFGADSTNKSKIATMAIKLEDLLEYLCKVAE